ncbi:MAG: FAD-binding oxidoreductase [Candidatus Nanopelagicales bacterium]
MNSLIAELTAAGVPIRDDQIVREAVGVDWTGRFRGDVLAVARPHTTAEVQLVVRACSERGLTVQIQGGNTGLVGGSVPPAGMPCVVLLTTGLAQVGPLDPGARTVRVGAGATLATAAAAAREGGLLLGVDLAARDSATIGGMVATNAGGMRVCAYGMMRAQVRGVRAVLADGSELADVRALPKDNTGYDLAGLLTGSEGTLGVITEVVLGLHYPAVSSLGLMGVETLAEAVAAAQAVAGHFPVLAAEVVDRTGQELAARLGSSQPPRPIAPWLLLVEVADGGECAGLEPLAELDPIVATTPGEQARLWSFREDQALFCAAAAGSRPVHKFDVSAPLGRMDELAAGFAHLMTSDPAVAGSACFGHVLDGNLHLEAWGPRADAHEQSDAIYGLVSELGGSISAEHGVGRAKVPYLGLSRSPAELAAMSGIRRAFDPTGLFNPGVLTG